MRCLLQAVPEQRPLPGERAPLPSDLPLLAQLISASFTGSIDEGQVDLLNTAAEVSALFSGEYGRFLADCSRLIEVDGTVVSAVLITLWQGSPLVAFAMTHPGCQRQGFARQSLLGSMRALADLGYAELYLVVSAGNLPAVNLYRSLGFLPQQP